MGLFNPRNVVDLLLKNYGHLKSTPIQESEIRMKDTIKELLDNYVQDRNPWCEEDATGTLHVDEPDTLSRTRSGLRIDDPQTNPVNVPEEEEEYEEEKDEDGNHITLSYKTKAVDHWRSCKRKPRRDLRSVQHTYKKVKSISQLERWEKTVLNSGTVIEKHAEIDRKVKEKFDEAKGGGEPIHDLDIQRWAVEVGKEILPDFKASPHWLHNFKIKHSICSRKINKFVTKVQSLDAAKIKESAEHFVTRVKKDIERVGEENTYNSDQSGFSFELRSGRSLHTKGVKKVNILVQRLNSLTHSYTVQPILKANGEFLKPMLIVLPEPKGTFGPIVKQSLFQAPNLKIVASKSGKCTSAILKDWYINVFCAQIKADSIILLDAFGGFNAATDSTTASAADEITSSEEESAADSEDNKTEIVSKERPPEIKVHRIPKNTTGLIQPLDRFGFRLYKNLLRTTSDRIVLQKHDFELAVRNNVLRLQSLIFNLLCSPRFRETFKYGWYASGYIVRHPQPFQTPAEYCYPRHLGSCEKCQDLAYIRCSWCTEHLCFNHFVTEYHLCEKFVE